MPDNPSYTISHAETKDDLAAIARLFAAYAESLGIDLTFQDFSTEMSDMPGKYGKPTGALLLAKDTAGHAFGCVGMRPLRDKICEMKRLYVSTEGRGTGAGRALAESVIQQARASGYTAMRLDTLSSMSSAIALYKSLGFYEIEAYYDTPLSNTIFLELRL